jgi:hypothetical protein
VIANMEKAADNFHGGLFNLALDRGNRDGAAYRTYWQRSLTRR